ncbi:MAG: glycoside hydrolase domain-containing protein [Saprospiraceae bacterium]
MKPFKIINTSWCTTLKIDCLKVADIETVIRYFDSEDSCQFPQERIELDEIFALKNCGMNIIVVFQKENSSLENFNYENGYKDGKYAFSYATKIEQPLDSAIYFAANFNVFDTDLQKNIIPYFKGVKQAFENCKTKGKPTYSIGVYGSGLAINDLKNLGLIQYRWLSMNSNFIGTQEALEEEQYDLRQVYTPINRLCQIEVNYNLQNPNVQNIGAFNWKNYTV